MVSLAWAPRMWQPTMRSVFALAMIFTGADTSGFEEDARLTAMWLWTLSTGLSGSGKTSEEEEDVYAGLEIYQEYQ